LVQNREQEQNGDERELRRQYWFEIVPSTAPLLTIIRIGNSAREHPRDTELNRFLQHYVEFC